MNDIDKVIEALRRSFLFQINCKLTDVQSKILLDRIAELETFIDQLIEAGNELTANPTVGNYAEREAAWTKLWLKWKARNELQEL